MVLYNMPRIKPPTKCQDPVRSGKAFDKSIWCRVKIIASLLAEAGSNGVIQMKRVCQRLKCDASAGRKGIVAEQAMRSGLAFCHFLFT